jgi:cob(I)alamin adenosyltransferase
MVKNVYAEEEVLTRIANALFDLAVSLAEKKKYQEKKLA